MVPGHGEVTFTADAVRAFPESVHEHASPFPVTLDAWQRRLHVVLTPDKSIGDLDAAMRGQQSPELELSDGQTTVAVGKGEWLRKSVTFELGDVASKLTPGVWTATVRVGSVTIAAVPDILRAAAGDVNRDGAFDSSDIVAILQAGKYEKDVPASVDDGDVTGDGRVTSADLVRMLQGDAGVTYESGAYAKRPSADPRQDPEGRWIVGNYDCWLAALGQPQKTFNAAPQDKGGNFRWNTLEVHRTCSSSAYDPKWEPDPFDMVYTDISVPFFVRSGCSYGGSDPEDANEDLGPIGESYQPGPASISGEYGHRRDVVMICEPEYFRWYSDDWVTDEAMRAIPRMRENDSCNVSLDVQAEGMANAWSGGEIAIQTTSDGQVSAHNDVLIPAEATTSLQLGYPDLAALGPADGQPAGADFKASPRQLSAVAYAKSEKCDVSLINDVQCRFGVGLDLSKGLLPKAECFAVISGKAIVENLTACAGNPEQAHARAYLAEGEAIPSKNPKETGTIEYAGAIHTSKEIRFTPVVEGPFRKSLGPIYVQSQMSATSHAKIVSDVFPFYVSSLIYASMATSGTDAFVQLSLSTTPVPDPPDNLSSEESIAWQQKHYAHCSVINPPAPKSWDSGPFWSEPNDQGQVVMQRGRAVRVSTAYETRYNIQRNTGKVSPLPWQ